MKHQHVPRRFDRAQWKTALLASVLKLDPRVQVQNPVMALCWLGALLTTALWVSALMGAVDEDPGFAGQVALWLWGTVLFANAAEALAEGRAKAQADALKGLRQKTSAKRLTNPDAFANAHGVLQAAPDYEIVDSESLRKGDVVFVEAGDIIPCDGDVLAGCASVDESAVTGESAPVIRESGGDFSSVTGGTTVLSDRIVVRASADPGESFVERMIGMVEGAKRGKTPNEIALTILLVTLTIVFLLVTATLLPYSIFSSEASGTGKPVGVTALTALLVCLIPTTIGGLLSAIGVAGMSRLLSANVIARSGRAVEAAGDVDVLLLDKTGTITFGNRRASALTPVSSVRAADFLEACFVASYADDTPEGKSVVQLALAEAQRLDMHLTMPEGASFVPFSAQTRMSGANLANGRVVRKGSADAIERYLKTVGGNFPHDVRRVVDATAARGSTPLVVASDGMILGVIELKDIVKPGIADRFADLRRMGIKTVMVTGDNRLTAAAIASEAGVDDFLAEATPELKLETIRRYQAEGRLVAMTGDGTNDAPALAQADVAVAMNSGTAAAKEAANMVDLDSSPTKLIDVVKIGKQMLMTRGALTTFSLANDVAKYFAIIPAAFAGVYPQLGIMNVMGLTSPNSAMLSAVIFNALVIVALIPLALKGVSYRTASAAELLRRNLLIYGLGGILAPFVGIKLIDILLTTAGLA